MHGPDMRPAINNNLAHPHMYTTTQPNVQPPSCSRRSQRATNTHTRSHTHTHTHSFVTFEEEESVKKVFSAGQMHTLGGKQVS